MFSAVVQIVKTDTPLPHAEVVFHHTHVEVDDAAATVQSFDLDGSETPPWSVKVDNLADGAGQVTAQDVDTNGNPIGAVVSVPFSGSGTGTPANFPATTGITVTPA